MKNNNILNSPLYRILNYVMYFFITNILFLLMISPLVVYWVIFQDNISTTVLLLLSILIGPSITTMFSVMGKLIREGDISPVKDFFYFYKINLGQSLLISIILNIAISIAYFDMNYFSQSGNIVMTYLFLTALILVLIINLYIYPLISRYNLRTFHTLKISMNLFIKKPYISLTSASIIIIILGLLRVTKLSLIGLLFGVSIICYIIMKVQKKTIDGLENYIKDLYQ